MANIAGHKSSKAHNLVTQAISAGKLTKPSICELCDRTTEKIVGHHWEGYDHPLSLWWVCPRCNAMLFGKHDGSISKNEARRMALEYRQDILSRPNRIQALLDEQDMTIYELVSKLNESPLLEVARNGKRIHYKSIHEVVTSYKIPDKTYYSTIQMIASVLNVKMADLDTRQFQPR